MTAPTEFDGIYFLPGDDDSEMIISYFEFKEEYANGKPVGSNDIGDMFHFAFFRRDENGEPIFDDAFEAILGDPSTYVKNLAGANVYGCVVRKTDKSGKWFEDYLNKTAKRFMIQKMINAASAIAESK